MILLRIGLLLLIGLIAEPPAVPQAADQPRTLPALQAQVRSSRIGVANFSDQPVSDIRIEGTDPKDAIVVPTCAAKQVLPPRKTAIDAAALLKVSFNDEQHRRHQAQFTRPDFGCGDGTDEHFTYTLYIGFDHQMFIRTAYSDAYRENDRWHVPDDHAGHITGKPMSEPQLVGIGPHDPFFDITFALVRYPIYDQLTLCRVRDDVGGARSTVCDGLIIREIPPATTWFLREIRQRSIALVGDRRSLEFFPASDAGPLPLPPAATQPVYPAAPKRGPLYHDGPLDVLTHALFGVTHRKSQGLGASNWGQRPIEKLQIKASDGSYKWTNPIRGGGGGEHLSVTELTLSGTLHVTYTDGNGNNRAADFENVPDIHGANDPQRILTFDASYNALLHCYDITENFTRGDDRWLLTTGGPKPEERLDIPQLIGVGGSVNGGPPSSALVRYPRNDSISEYSPRQMIGGDYYDVTSHNTADGVPRYRIESITATEMVLIRDGKRISVPLMKESAAK